MATKPQQYAQAVKAGRGWLIVRNSATLADTDYKNVADEIVSALNNRVDANQSAAPELLEALDAVMTTYVKANLCPFGVSAYEKCDCNYHAAVKRASAAMAKATPPASK